MYTYIHNYFIAPHLSIKYKPAHTYSSRRSSVKKSSQPFIVNDLIVLFFNQLGLGHTAMKKL